MLHVPVISSFSGFTIPMDNGGGSNGFTKCCYQNTLFLDHVSTMLKCVKKQNVQSRHLNILTEWYVIHENMM